MIRVAVFIFIFLIFSCSHRKTFRTEKEVIHELAWQNVKMEFDDTVVYLSNGDDYINLRTAKDSITIYHINKEEISLLVTEADSLIHTRTSPEVFCTDYVGNLRICVRYATNVAEEIKFSSICDWRKINNSTQKIDSLLRKIFNNKSSNFKEYKVMRAIVSLQYTCFLTLFLAATISCQSSKKITSQKNQYKEIYLDQFKLTYFRKLLVKSYNNSSAVQEIMAADHSGFTEPVLSEEDVKMIDSLTTMDNQYLVSDSLDGYRRTEGSQGKRPIGYIMTKLKSKWLDSLAKKRLKVNGITNNWIK